MVKVCLPFNQSFLKSRNLQITPIIGVIRPVIGHLRAHAFDVLGIDPKAKKSKQYSLPL